MGKSGNVRSKKKRGENDHNFKRMEGVKCFKKITWKGSTNFKNNYLTPDSNPLFQNPKN